MTPFEEQLKQALTRREPGSDFTARVLAKVEERPVRQAAGSPLEWLRQWRMWRMAAAVAALLVMSGSVAYKEHERTVRGEAAKEKLLLALQIAGSELHDARQHVMGIEITEREQ